MPIDPFIPDEYVNAAIDKLRSPAPDSQYLNQALDLIKSGQALVNPIASGITSAIGSATSSLSSLSSGFGWHNIPTVNEDGSIDLPAPTSPEQIDATMEAFVSSSVFGDLSTGLTTAKTMAGDISAVTDRMLTSINPFDDAMELPKSFKLPGLDLGYAEKLGVPQLSTLFNVASSQQALNTNLGRTDGGDNNPCAALSSSIGSMVGTISGTVDTVKDHFSSIANSVGSVISDASMGAQTAIRGVIDSIKTQIGTVIEWTSEGIAAIKSQISSLVASSKSVIDSALGEVSGFMSDATSKMHEMISGATNAVGGIIGAIKQTADSIVEQVQAGFASLIKSAPSLNPCAQGVLLGDQGILSNDMADLVLANMPPSSVVAIPVPDAPTIPSTPI